MITDISVMGWKAYDSLATELTGGTTFVVAHNGVGKTSLMQAVEWAITGKVGGDPPDASFIRNGSDAAEVSLRLKAESGATLKIVRALTPTSQGGVSGTLRLDDAGAEGSDAELSRWLRSSFGFDQAIMSRLCFLPEGGVLAGTQDPERAFNVVEFVSELFGAGALAQQAEALEAHAGKSGRRGDRLRTETSQGSDQRVRELMALVSEIDEELPAVRERKAEVEKLVEERRRFDQRAGERRAEAAELEVASSQVVALLAALGFEAGAPDDAFPVLRLREDLELELREREESLEERRRSLDARCVALSEALERLSSHIDLCPTCQRPFASDERSRIREGISAALQASSEALGPVIDELGAARQERARFRQESDKLRGLLETWQQLAARSMSEELPEPVVDLELYDQIATRLADLEARRTAAMSEIDSISDAVGSNADAMAAYRDGYTAQLMAESFRAARREIFRLRVDPLATEVAHRWKEIWPGSANLALGSGGALELSRSGGKIAMKGFSGGERAVAVVLLRLLAAQMAGRSPFMWFDEPLEHLDARNRRLLASVLAASAASGAVGQVVVTTYEDAVTRRLADQYAGDLGCRTLYVRSDTGD